ncbi:MAG: tetratricopeptide repeat protein [Microcoleus sp.]
MTDAEYEAKLMELLEGVNQGWGRGDVAEFLIAKRIKNGDLAAWLRRFGVRLLEGAQGSTEGGHGGTAPTDAVVSLRELARRLELLGRVAGGELGEVAGNVGREILVEFPLVSDEGGEDFDGEAEAWCDRAREQYIKGDFEGAIASLDQALELKSDDYEFLNNRGLVLHQLGRLLEAIASFDKSLKLKPDNEAACFNLSPVMRKLGRLEEAIASYDKALKSNPDNDTAWNDRGAILCDDLKRYEEAIASFDKSLEIEPNDRISWINRSNAVSNASGYNQLVYEILQLQFPKSPPVTRTLITHKLTQRGYEGQVLTLKTG